MMRGLWSVDLSGLVLEDKTVLNCDKQMWVCARSGMVGAEEPSTHTTRNSVEAFIAGRGIKWGMCFRE